MYLKSDVFKNAFKNLLIRSCKVSLSTRIIVASAGGFLKRTEVELKKLTDIDIHDKCNKCNITNNKCMKDYDKNKESAYLKKNDYHG